MIYETVCLGSSEKGVNLAVTTGGHRYYLYGPAGMVWKIEACWISCGTSPTGASILVDINKNGTTIFTTQANRPAVAISGNASGRVSNMDVTTLASGDYLTADIDQVGSTVIGQDLLVYVEISTKF